jgi:hypothetical protein
MKVFKINIFKSAFNFNEFYGLCFPLLVLLEECSGVHDSICIGMSLFYIIYNIFYTIILKLIKLKISLTQIIQRYIQ